MTMIVPRVGSPYDAIIFRYFGWLVPYRDNRVVRELATGVTFLRLLALPCAWPLYHSFRASNTLHALIWLVTAFALAATDAFDGSFAWLLDHQTKFGAALDPLLDKVWTITMIVVYLKLPSASGGWLGPVCGVVLISVIILEAALALTSGFQLLTRRTSQANKWGKYKFNIEVGGAMAGFSTMLLSLRFDLVPLSLSFVVTGGVFLVAARYALGSLAGRWTSHNVAN